MKHAFLTFVLGLTLCGTVAANPPSLTNSGSLLDLHSLESPTTPAYPAAETLSYSDSQFPDQSRDNDLPVSHISDTDLELDELETELRDLYTEQIMDMQRAIDLLRLQLQLGDDLIYSQAVQIRDLQSSIESVKRLSDARVAAEKARCPKCLKPWLQWTTRGLAFAVGGVAGRGSCDFGN